MGAFSRILFVTILLVAGIVFFACGGGGEHRSDRRPGRQARSIEVPREEERQEGASLEPHTDGSATTETEPEKIPESSVDARYLPRCEAIYEELRDLYTEVCAARERTFSDAEWGVFIRDFNHRAEAARQQARSLPEDHPARLPLAVSAGNLLIVVLEVAGEKFFDQEWNYDLNYHLKFMTMAEEAIDAMRVVANTRTWTDSTGEHVVEAEFRGCVSGKVRLRKQDDSEITIETGQ